MKLKTAIIMLSCVMLCSCESYTQKPSASSLQLPDSAVSSHTSTTKYSAFESTTAPSAPDTEISTDTSADEATSEITLPTMFTEEEEWLHNFFELNYEDAYMFAKLESMGSDGDIEVCIAGNDHIEIYGKISSNDYFANAEKYREKLSEYYSTDIVEVFMDNVTVARTIKETGEQYYDAEGIDRRIYIEAVTPRDEVSFTKYIEIDGVMYKNTGESSRGTCGVFEYSKIVSMTDDEIIFTYPLKQEYTDELILIAVAEGRLVKEDGVWKFGWHLSYDNCTEKYNEIWYV